MRAWRLSRISSSLGSWAATLAGQVRQLEAITGITLLHTSLGTTITLTATASNSPATSPPCSKC
jgi:hypothetical protein